MEFVWDLIDSKNNYWESLVKFTLNNKKSHKASNPHSIPNKISLNILDDTHVQGSIIIMVVDGKAMLRRAFKPFPVINILKLLKQSMFCPLISPPVALYHLVLVSKFYKCRKNVTIFFRFYWELQLMDLLNQT